MRMGTKAFSHQPLRAGSEDVPGAIFRSLPFADVSKVKTYSNCASRVNICGMAYPFRDRVSLVLRRQEPVSVATGIQFSSGHRSTVSIGLNIIVLTFGIISTEYIHKNDGGRNHHFFFKRSRVRARDCSCTYSCHKSVARKPPSTDVFPLDCQWSVCA